MRRYKILLVLILSFFLTSIVPQNSDAFSDQIISRGAFGDDVIELQSRLQYIGYYNGTIDGKFGYGTYWALRNFQEQYGLPIDGVAGATTKTKLTSVSQYDKAYVMDQINKGNKFTYYGGQQKSSAGTGAGTNMQVPNNFTEQDLKLMANAVYGEARGEPYEGQVAVAAVILNRLDSPDFPNTISGIIFQPRAFTAVADGQIWLTPNKQAMEAVIDAMNGWDPSQHALYYFNPKTATSQWIWTRKQITQIGEHIFCI
ncbi:spore cortex-lytic enzyme [Rummeliibacillus pycnus]|uniref:spore cortex-lytic enzyme n=1 Tax=Rummeliibacillus pycnus TaxID=101070 RepID=UPI0037C50189